MTRLILQIIALLCFWASAYATPVSDVDMKTALIYNFSIYTAWPESKSNTFNVCLFEADQGNLNAQLLLGKKLNGIPISLRVIQHTRELNSCQVLYLEEVLFKNQQEFVKDLDHHPILTVSFQNSGFEPLSIITIGLEDKKLIFSVNNQIAKEMNITLSSKLLRLAKEVN